MSNPGDKAGCVQSAGVGANGCPPPLPFGSGGTYPVLDTRIVFRYPPREIRCPTHGRRQEWIPFAAPHSQVTHRLDYLLVYHCKAMTQKAAAERLHLAPSTLSDLLHRVIERTREGHRIRGLRKIGIDEISYRKGHQYATIVYDLEKRRVLWVGKGKGRETIDRFFKEELSEAQRLSITEASCDMSETFIGAIKDHCPNATLTLDTLPPGQGDAGRGG